MSLRNTYTDWELKLLQYHHLDTGSHSQLSDAFVIGYRKASDESLNQERLVKAEIIYDLIEELKWCGTDGEAWKSELTQLAIKFEKEEN